MDANGNGNAGTSIDNIANATSAPSSHLPAGMRAPDFTLRTTPDQWVSLHDFCGEPVILAFYPADWSPVCGDQMALYNEVLPEFQPSRLPRLRAPPR